MIDIICNRYIRLSRDRMNYNLGNEEYQKCFQILNYVLYNFIETTKSILPSKYLEWKPFIFQPLRKFDSDTSDEIDFDICYKIIELGRRLRDEHKIRFTLPIVNLNIYLSNNSKSKVIPSSKYLYQELNVNKLILKILIIYHVFSNQIGVKLVNFIEKNQEIFVRKLVWLNLKMN